ncbi:MAG: hypothetical protein U9N77_14875 [Thermodesulfobacteriota bacterium]|nr:hypothetical protein [Thermodesulfobacteriota bacterium]
MLRTIDNDQRDRGQVLERLPLEQGVKSALDSFYIFIYCTTMLRLIKIEYPDTGGSCDEPWQAVRKGVFCKPVLLVFF